MIGQLSSVELLKRFDWSFSFETNQNRDRGDEHRSFLKMRSTSADPVGGMMPPEINALTNVDVNVSPGSDVQCCRMVQNL